MIEDRLKSIVKDAVMEVVTDMEILNIKMDNSSSEIMTTKQLADYLQCSIPWLSKNIKKLELPVCKLGGKEYRFLKSEIDEWLRHQTIKKTEKITTTASKSNNSNLRII